jgi:head-tail adaptor
VSGPDSLGAMRERVTLHGEHRDTGAGGRIQETYPVIADVWAQVTSRSGLPAVAGGREAEISATILVHHDAAYMTARHVSWGGRRFRVQEIVPVGSPVCWLRLAVRHMG